MRSCVVFNSTTRGKVSRAVSCHASAAKAKDEARVLNRLQPMGGFYSVHKASVIRSWRDRGDSGDWSLAGGRR